MIASCETLSKGGGGREGGGEGWEREGCEGWERGRG